jgi:hypothetical protein
MDGMDPKILLICAALAAGYFVAKPIKHGIQKAAHGVVHVVTLGKK